MRSADIAAAVSPARVHLMHQALDEHHAEDAEAGVTGEVEDEQPRALHLAGDEQQSRLPTNQTAS